MTTISILFLILFILWFSFLGIAAYTTMASSQTDADSPINQTLADAFRTNLDMLLDYIGGNTHTPATDHDHDGVNSALTNIGGSPEIESMREEDSAVGSGATTSYTTLYTKKFYNHKEGAKTIEFTCRIRRASGSNTEAAAISIDGGGEIAEVTTTSSSFSYKSASESAGTLTVGWHTVEVRQKRGSADTMEIQGFSVACIPG